MKIVLLAVVAAVIYGILHDQVTARVCVEYFTIYHPPIFGGTQNPTLLAVGWGVIATWWVGLPLGLMLAVCARVGGLPKLRARELVRPIAVTLAVLGLMALACGLVGYWIPVVIATEIPTRLPPDRMPRLQADAFAHLASYGFGAILGLVLSGYALFLRFGQRSMAGL